MPTSKELLEMANTEWKNREERKGIHDEVSWTSGWISGFLTTNNVIKSTKLVVGQGDRDFDDYCKLDLTQYVWGDKQSDEVGLCRGKDCNYCGRYSEELRQAGE